MTPRGVPGNTSRPGGFGDSVLAHGRGLLLPLRLPDPPRAEPQSGKNAMHLHCENALVSSGRACVVPCRLHGETPLSCSVLGFAAALTLVSRSFLIRDLLCGRARSTARRSTAFSHTSTLVIPSRINRLDAILVEPALCSHLFPAGKGADSAHCLDHSHRENALAEFSRRTARSAKRGNPSQTQPPSQAIVARRAG